MKNIFKLNSSRFTGKVIEKIAAFLKEGKIGIIPTETVYGIAGSIENKETIERIFKIKARKRNKPFAIAICDIKQLKKLVSFISPAAKKLIKNYWPGPLTIVFKVLSNVPKYITRGLDTVAIRMPDNIISLAIIRKTGNPLVLTSANISGKKSPIIPPSQFKGVDFLVDNGKTRLGIESTVVDVTKNNIKVLREGALSSQELSKIIKK